MGRPRTTKYRANPVNVDAALVSRREIAKAQHIEVVNELLAAIAEHPNRAVAAYLMGVVSTMTNFQASRFALEEIHSIALQSATVSRFLCETAIGIALADNVKERR